MVTFLTLFLGLVAGNQQIQVAVSPDVARVQILVDERPLCEMAGEPWSAVCDLGHELRPREMVAVAYGRDGEEIARDHLVLNLPQRTAEAKIVPEFDAVGQVSAARLVWESPELERPKKITALLDGRRARFRNKGRIDLSRCDADSTHLLTVTFRFSKRVVLERELVFGQDRVTSTSSDLTSVTVVLEGLQELPPVAQLDEWFVKDGEPLEVKAVEAGQGNVVAVRDFDTVTELSARVRWWKDNILKSPGGSTVKAPEDTEMGRFCRLRENDLIQIVDPVLVATTEGARYSRLFPLSSTTETTEHSFCTFLGETKHLKNDDRRLADAVAVAGTAAAMGNHPRAVVLMIGDKQPDASHYRPLDVRAFLSAIHVPLRVWDLSDEKAEPDPNWGMSSPVTTFEQLQAEVGNIRDLLDHQRIVWVAGQHLPLQIRLGPAAHGIRIAGSFASQ
jgi:hypothetical protein